MTYVAFLVFSGFERLRDGYATSLGASSGLVAGLVAITPAAGDINPVSSLALGFIGGILACFGVGLKYTFNYDDSLDVVGVHLVAGIWGTVARCTARPVTTSVGPACAPVDYRWATGQLRSSV